PVSGFFNSGPTSFPGQIADVRIYNYALPESLIQNIYHDPWKICRPNNSTIILPILGVSYRTGSGGISVSGFAYQTYNETGSGGAKVDGTAVISKIDNSRIILAPNNTISVSNWTGSPTTGPTILHLNVGEFLQSIPNFPASPPGDGD